MQLSVLILVLWLGTSGCDRLQTPPVPSVPSQTQTEEEPTDTRDSLGILKDVQKSQEVRRQARKTPL